MMFNGTLALGSALLFGLNAIASDLRIPYGDGPFDVSDAARPCLIIRLSTRRVSLSGVIGYFGAVTGSLILTTTFPIRIFSLVPIAATVARNDGYAGRISSRGATNVQRHASIWH